jgi:hypothetical protein
VLRDDRDVVAEMGEWFRHRFLFVLDADWGRGRSYCGVWDS